MKSLLLSLLFLSGCTSIPAKADSTLKHCPDEPERQALRSQELRRLVKEDLMTGPTPSTGCVFFQEMKPGARESERSLVRVALKLLKTTLLLPLFTNTEHSRSFFQTFIWAKKAVELGDPSQKRLMAMSIDRYLINIGHKQLFATQASNHQ